MADSSHARLQVLLLECCNPVHVLSLARSLNVGRISELTAVWALSKLKIMLTS